jgi:hypothetical protein
MNMANENCLEGIRCPQCGNEERLIITANVVAEVTDDGAEVASSQYGNGFEWDDESMTRCPECDRDGPLKGFHATPDLPPDPEGMNDRRAGWAGRAIANFRAATGTDEEDAVCDLLADLMHWCNRHGLNFGNELARARDHYDAETHGEKSTD